MDPYRVIWTARSLSPENKRLFTGPARTVRPTADGMAIRRENRIAAATFFFTMRRSPVATARDTDGISDEDRALETAMGTLIRRWYFPVYTPHWEINSSSMPRLLKL